MSVLSLAAVVNDMIDNLNAANKELDKLAVNLNKAKDAAQALADVGKSDGEANQS